MEARSLIKQQGSENDIYIYVVHERIGWGLPQPTTSLKDSSGGGMI